MSTKKISKYRDYSVMNLDNFDKRNFERIMDMSKGLSELSQKVSDEFYTFQPLLNDIWGSLYKVRPELQEDVREELTINHSFMNRIMNDPSFENYRSYTKMDDLSSAVGAIKFGNETYEWVKQQQEENQRIKELMEQIQQMKKQQDKNQKPKKNESKEDFQNRQEQLNNQMEQSMSDLNAELQNSLGSQGTSGLGSALKKAFDETKSTSDSVKSLLGGGAGNNDPEFKKVPLRDQLQLAEILSNNKKMREIAELAGRFKNISRKKQKSKRAKNIDRNGITLGNDIELLLPSELGLFVNPKTKADFLRRFAEGQTLMYDNKGKAELGKGPIICCLDQSGSMEDLDVAAKGFVLALMWIAKKQKRDFCYIPFSSKTGRVRRFSKGNITIEKMVELSLEFMDGGTNFKRPLTEALSVINESRFNKADIVFITDGEDRVDNDFIESYNKVKKEKQFNVLSLCISPRKNSFQTLLEFSDKVVPISDFNDTDGHAAFEI